VGRQEGQEFFLRKTYILNEICTQDIYIYIYIYILVDTLIKIFYLSLSSTGAGSEL
jgi:hypothetical protein